jgi:hypothetical protein
MALTGAPQAKIGFLRYAKEELRSPRFTCASKTIDAFRALAYDARGIMIALP